MDTDEYEPYEGEVGEWVILDGNEKVVERFFTQTAAEEGLYDMEYPAGYTVDWDAYAN